MKTSINAFRIEPDRATQRMTVSPIELSLSPDGELLLHDCYSTIGCNLVQFLSIDEGEFAGHSLIFDEEGLVENPPGFLWHESLTCGAPLAGVVLMVGDHPKRRTRACDPQSLA